MFDSRSRIIKILGFVLMGFIVLIMIISFGMPDFISTLRRDDNTVTTVNGKKVYRLDFLRYRDRMAQRMENTDKKEMQDYILSSLIIRELMLQKADDLGIRITDQNVMNMIKSIPAFKNKDGNFNKEYMNAYLSHYHMAFSDFYNNMREDLLLDEFQRMIFEGEGVSPEEINMDYKTQNSPLQIKYCFLSAQDINAKYKALVSITEKEIDDELATGKNEIKDPSTDRKRIREKIEARKLNEFKKEIIKKIDDIALAKKSFAEAASILGGKTLVSAEFKTGDQIKSGDGKKIIYSLSNSPAFTDTFFSLVPGQASRAIDSFDGIYVFTPVKNKFTEKKPSADEYTKIESDILNQKNNSVYYSLLSALREKAKIVKNLKMD